MGCLLHLGPLCSRDVFQGTLGVVGHVDHSLCTGGFFHTGDHSGGVGAGFESIADTRRWVAGMDRDDGLFSAHRGAISNNRFHEAVL